MEWAGPGHPLPVSHGVIARALHTGEPVVLDDASMDAEFHARHSVQRLGLRLIVAVPVPAHGQNLGVLYVDSRIKSVPDTVEKIEFLTALARLVGTAVENAELFEEQRFRAMLLAELVHDFKTPLAVISANAAVLSEREGDVTEIAGDIDAGAAAPGATRIDLAEAVHQHVATFDALARQRGLSLRVEAAGGLPAAATIPDRVWIILDNLLFNAFKHAAGGSTIRIALGTRGDAGPVEARERVIDPFACLFQRVAPLAPLAGSPFLLVSVENTGRPIPPELLQCARHLGGLVWASSDDAATVFAFTLPTQLAVG